MVVGDFSGCPQRKKIFGGSIVLSLLVKMRDGGKLKKEKNKRESQARAK